MWTGNSAQMPKVGFSKVFWPSARQLNAQVGLALQTRKDCQQVGPKQTGSHSNSNDKLNTRTPFSALN